MEEFEYLSNNHFIIESIQEQEIDQIEKNLRTKFLNFERFAILKNLRETNVSC